LQSSWHLDELETLDLVVLSHTVEEVLEHDVELVVEHNELDEELQDESVVLEQLERLDMLDSTEQVEELEELEELDELELEELELDLFAVHELKPVTDINEQESLV
jgi:hypothetical protein